MGRHAQWGSAGTCRCGLPPAAAQPIQASPAPQAYPRGRTRQPSPGAGSPCSPRHSGRRPQPAAPAAAGGGQVVGRRRKGVQAGLPRRRGGAPALLPSQAAVQARALPQRTGTRSGAKTRAACRGVTESAVALKLTSAPAASRAATALAPGPPSEMAVMRGVMEPWLSMTLVSAPSAGRAGGERGRVGVGLGMLTTVRARAPQPCQCRRKKHKKQKHKTHSRAAAPAAACCRSPPRGTGRWCRPGRCGRWDPPEAGRRSAAPPQQRGRRGAREPKGLTRECW